MLKVSAISKAFPGVQALDSVDFDVRGGEVHALVGENGAGKSTLTKIIAGVYGPDSGEINFAGAAVRWRGPVDAKRAGIHVIYQEFVLFPHLSVAENVTIGDAPRGRARLLDLGERDRVARAAFERLGVAIDVDRRVVDLTVAEQQMVEIAKALVREARVLILDEPTAVISGPEIDLLFARLRTLRQSGVAIVYISHRLEEIFRLCDRVTVLKDGRLVGTHAVTAVDRGQLIQMMVGRDLAHRFPPPPPGHAPGPVVLRAAGVCVPGRVRAASLELRAGEITGLAGMVGAGRSELALAIFGAIRMSAGTVTVDGESILRPSAAKSMARGIGLVSEDRKGAGLAMDLDIAANVSAASLGSVGRGGVLDRGAEREIAVAAIDRYRIACRGPATRVATMSGGNQQKVLIARWARVARRVLILDEPTRGVDVGAKIEIYGIMRELAASGVAILLISSELPEIVGMSDRVFVMREGVVTGLLDRGQVSEQSVMDLAAHPRAA